MSYGFSTLLCGAVSVGILTLQIPKLLVKSCLTSYTCTQKHMLTTKLKLTHEYVPLSLSALAIDTYFNHNCFQSWCRTSALLYYTLLNKEIVRSTLSINSHTKQYEVCVAKTNSWPNSCSPKILFTLVHLMKPSIVQNMSYTMGDFIYHLGLPSSEKVCLLIHWYAALVNAFCSYVLLHW